MITHQGKAAPNRLYFNENGEFKILLISDTQDIDVPHEYTIKLLCAALDSVNADLIILLGDQIESPALGDGEERTQNAIERIIAPIVERQLPFALVFGNHDVGGSVSKEQQMLWYKSYPNCLATEGENMTGCGNYLLQLSDKNSNPIINLWFFDSNAYSIDGVGDYDYVHQDQLDWYLRTSARITAQNGGIPMASYVFQHIVVPEIYEALEQVDEDQKDEAGVVRGFGYRCKQYYRIPKDGRGSLSIFPLPPDVNGGEFDAWLESGGVVAAFFGHDHTNSYEVNYKGIDLVCTYGAGFLFYDEKELHGVRIITLHEEDPTRYETRLLRYNDIIAE